MQLYVLKETPSNKGFPINVTLLLVELILI